MINGSPVSGSPVSGSPMSVTKIPGNLRPAQPGDLCLLLVPATTEADYIGQWQRTMQTHFGGHRTRPVHITCQRFVCQHPQQMHEICRNLQMSLTVMLPLLVTGLAISPFYSAFRQEHILKCHIQITQELECLGETVKQILVKAGVRPHYPWLISSLVTVLEGIPASQNTLDMNGIHFPYPLFAGCKIVLSRVKEANIYDVVTKISLFS